MSYVASNLTTGEQVVALGRVHWSVYVPGALFAALGVLIVVAGVTPAGVALLAGSAVMLARGWVHSSSTELAITNKRVIAKFGFLRRHTVELLHSKVEGFVVEQGIMGRILDYGTVVVNGTGSGKTPIPQIAAPLEFRKAALGAIEDRA